MRQLLRLPAGLDGNLWLHRDHGGILSMHHHPELEFNLVTRGRGCTCSQTQVPDRPGTCLALSRAGARADRADRGFRDVDRVFKPKLYGGLPSMRRQRYCGRQIRWRLLPAVASGRPGKVERCWRDSWSTRPGRAIQCRLSYALLEAWRCFEHAADVPAQDVHPAVEKAARIIRDNPESMSAEDLGRRAGLSPGG